ncbi:MAG: pilus assembly protein N-terminal domain-containing protein [Planctomycetes bacterium]|nr:pilus assembly protein N-terminal domain-containing protein [Planctomycetota bacterium]
MAGVGVVAAAGIQWFTIGPNVASRTAGINPDINEAMILSSAAGSLTGKSAGSTNARSLKRRRATVASSNRFSRP